MVWVLVVLAAALVAGCGSDEQPREPSTGSRTGPVGVISSIDGSKPTVFARLDPTSLQPRPPEVALGEYHDAWAFSPDGSLVAFGISAPAAGSAQRVGIRIVDLTRMTASRDISTGIAAVALGWLAPRRLVALLQSGEVVLVDPRTGDIRRRQSVGRLAMQCVPAPAAVTRQGLVLLLAAHGDAPARLVVVGAQGRLRSVSLAPIAIGGNCGRGGLAVDPAGERAFAVGRGSQVAQVDLATLRVTYQQPQGAEVASATRRSVLWLGDGSLAVAGHDRAGRPTGVAVIDTATWRSARIDASAGAARTAPSGALLVYDGRVGVSADKGIGLRAYRPDGSRLFRLLDGQRVWDVEVVEQRAYARTSTAVHIVDLHSGEVTDKVPPRGRMTEIVSRPK